MATDTRSLPAFFNTDADFRAWCQGIAAQLVVAGMVVTADTGQINNTTVTKPGAINTSQGYEIYKFSDSLQTGTPIYFKIEYGSGAAVDRPSLWITTGTGSNGSGTLTGPTTTRTQLQANASKTSGVTLPSYCSGDGSRVSLCTNYDSAGNNFPIFLCIDRLRDASNNTQTDGWTVAGISGNFPNAHAYQVQSVIGNVAQTNQTGNTAGAFVGPDSVVSTGLGGGARSYNNNIACMPAMVLAGQVRYLLSFVSYKGSDITGTAPTTVTVNNLGGSHTYLLIPGICGQVGCALTNGIAGGVNTVDELMMAWE